MRTLIKGILLALLGGWVGSAAAVPITDADIVTVNGTQWAQVDLFIELRWSDINAVCPAGICGNGTLNGHDMLGWTWASIADLNALFNAYLSAAGITGTDLLDPLQPDRLFDLNATTWAPAFFADGWRNIDCDCRLLETTGWTSERNSTGQFANVGDVTLGVPVGSFDNVSTDARFGAVRFSSNRIGAWFHRPAAHVPEPGTLLLLIVGLASWVIRRPSSSQ